jgi:uncharacterized protein (TIGR03118 family)
MGKRSLQGSRLHAVVAVAAVTLVTTGVLASASVSAPGSFMFKVTNLVSDQPGAAASVDPDLVNAWGLASSPTSPWWVSDNGTDVSTLYRADGSKVGLTVGVASEPTGMVNNTGSSFKVTNGTTSAAAAFIFSTEEGTILGWNPTVAPTTAEVAVPNTDDAVYKGLAIASTGAGDRLYATDFHNDRVDVFDGNFAKVNVAGAFVDPSIPSGYAPFGIQNVGGKIAVTYAEQDADRHDDVAGFGHGFVDVYDTNGTLLSRVASRGFLNSPWGIAMAPNDFGNAGGDLLIGNFGDGHITAFEPRPDGSFRFAEQLRTSSVRKLVTIDGLWALEFGKGTVSNGPATTLFFTAGPGGESHGLFGTITATGSG